MTTWNADRRPPPPWKLVRPQAEATGSHEDASVEVSEEEEGIEKKERKEQLWGQVLAARRNSARLELEVAGAEAKRDEWEKRALRAENAQKKAERRWATQRAGLTVEKERIERELKQERIKTQEEVDSVNKKLRLAHIEAEHDEQMLRIKMNKLKQRLRDATSRIVEISNERDAANAAAAAALAESRRLRLDLNSSLEKASHSIEQDTILPPYQHDETPPIPPAAAVEVQQRVVPTSGADEDCDDLHSIATSVTSKRRPRRAAPPLPSKPSKNPSQEMSTRPQQQHQEITSSSSSIASLPDAPLPHEGHANTFVDLAVLARVSSNHRRPVQPGDTNANNHNSAHTNNLPPEICQALLAASSGTFFQEKRRKLPS